MKKQTHKIDRALACKVGIELFKYLAQEGYTITKAEVEQPVEVMTVGEQSEPALVERVDYLRTMPDGSKVAEHETKERVVSKLIDMFKSVNPSYAMFYSRKGDRKVLAEMIDQYPVDTLFKLLEVLPQSNGMPYAPTITTPREFHRNAPKLVAFIQKKQSEKVSGFKIGI